MGGRDSRPTEDILNNMIWNRSQTLALAAHQCAKCHGLGLPDGQETGLNPCNCVLRNIFRICYTQFRQFIENEKYLSRVTLEIHSGPDRRGTWGRKEEEFLVDFLNLSRHALDEQEYRIFRYRYLLGADWRLCCRKLGMDRGVFHHSIYRIEQKLGRVFAEVEPYALYPVDEYLNSSTRRQTVKAFDVKTPRTVIPIRPPLRAITPAVELQKIA